MTGNDWLERLCSLAYRVESLGVVPDVAALSLCELWALYLFLMRLVDGGDLR